MDLGTGAGAQFFFRQTLRFLAIEQFMSNKDPVGAVDSAKRVRMAVARTVLERNPSGSFEQEYAALLEDFWNEVADDVREQVQASLSEAAGGLPPG